MMKGAYRTRLLLECQPIGEKLESLRLDVNECLLVFINH
jgi:hypothetical protein